MRNLTFLVGRNAKFGRPPPAYWAATMMIFKRTEKKRNRNSYLLRSARVRLNGERDSLGRGGSFRDGNFRANERG